MFLGPGINAAMQRANEFEMKHSQFSYSSSGSPINNVEVKNIQSAGCYSECGSGSRSWKRKRWKRFFFCGSGSAKILPLPHSLFDLKSNLVKMFCPFSNVD